MAYLSTFEKIPSEIGKLYLLIYSERRCPHCGAFIKTTDNICPCCGLQTQFDLMNEIDRKVKELFKGFTIETLERIKNEIIQVKDNFSVEINELFKKMDDYYRRRIEEELSTIKLAESEALEKIQKVYEEIDSKMEQFLDKVNKQLQRQLMLAPGAIFDLQQVSDEELEEVVNLSEDIWNFSKEGFPQNLISRFEYSPVLKAISNFLYSANEFEDALKWYSRYFYSTMFPISYCSENEFPKTFNITVIPFGAAYLSTGDIDNDGVEELIYTPNEKATGLNVPAVLLNDGGRIFRPTDSDNLLFPVFGRFGTQNVILFQKTSKRLDDFSAYTVNGNKLYFLREGRKVGYLPIKAITKADVNDDGVDELAILNGSGYTLEFYTSSETELKMIDKIICGRLLCLSSGDIDGDGKDEVVSIGTSGNVSIYSLEDNGISKYTLEQKIDTSELISTAVVDLDGDGINEFYFAVSDKPQGGIYKLSFSNGQWSIVPLLLDKAGAQPVDLIATLDVNCDGKKELIGLKFQNGGLIVNIFQQKKILSKISLRIAKNYLLENPATGITFSNYKIVVSSDFDGDGVSEVILSGDNMMVTLDPRW